MELRNGSLVGGSPGRLPLELRPAFEEGVRLILHRWTALCLAVENEWGGRDSRAKADRLFEDVLSFFYDSSEHFADDLEVDLEEMMLADFNAEIEDGSPRAVSRELVSLHGELLAGQNGTLARLRASAPAGVGESTLLADGNSTSDSGSESNSSSDGEADAMELDTPQPKEVGRQAPIVDSDGFQLVQGRRRGRGR